MSSFKQILLAVAVGVTFAAASPAEAREQRAGTIRATENGTVLIAPRDALAPGTTLDVVRRVHRPGPGKFIGTPWVHRVVGQVRVVGTAEGDLVRAERVSGGAWRGDYVTIAASAANPER